MDRTEKQKRGNALKETSRGAERRQVPLNRETGPREDGGMGVCWRDFRPRVCSQSGVKGPPGARPLSGVNKPDAGERGEGRMLNALCNESPAGFYFEEVTGVGGFELWNHFLPFFTHYLSCHHRYNYFQENICREMVGFVSKYQALSDKEKEREGARESGREREKERHWTDPEVVAAKMELV